MIMTLFIGPAICEPEKHGIIADIPISTIARHNLNQVNKLKTSIKKTKIFSLFRLLSYYKHWACQMMLNQKRKIYIVNLKK